MDIAAFALNAILVGLTLEAALLTWWLRRRGAARLTGPLLSFLTAGFLLILFARLVVANAPLPLLAIVLGLAGLAHAVCLLKTFDLLIAQR